MVSDLHLHTTQSTPGAQDRWWDWPAAALLILAIVTAGNRLVATQWTDYLIVAETTAFLGVIAGLVIGASRFSERLSGLLALAYGLFIVPYEIGATLPFQRDNLLWSEKLLVLADRIGVIIYQLINHQLVQDSLLFIVLMTLLYWILGVHAGYTLTRHGNGWGAVLPTGLAIFTIHAFDAFISRRAGYLAVYLFFALVLVARMAYLHHQSRWQKSRTALPPNLGLDFIRFTLAAVGVLVIIAWTVPALTNTLPAAEQAFLPIRMRWNEVRDRFDNVFASLRSSVGIVSDYYGSAVLLGRGNRLNDSLVLVVKPPANIPPGVRFYWRARTYETYSDGQWSNTLGASRPFSPQGQGPVYPNENSRWMDTFEITPATAVSTLFSPSQPLWVNRPSQMELVANPDGTNEVMSFRATPSLDPGQPYQVQSSVSTSTEAQLRFAGVQYPDYIQQRYLNLPASITERTLALGQRITASADTPYDKVIAVTNYLRSNIQYSETIPAKPDKQEAIDWFLFDLKQGFCNYYASAEVVLLRSVGIPARWSVGYAQGERQQDGTYLVRQKDAHAWPEVFFPGLGWVEFEPTAAQPVIARLPGSPTASASPTPNSEEERLQSALNRQQRDRDEAIREVQLGTGSGLTRRLSPYLLWTLGSLILLVVIGFQIARIFFGVSAFPVLVQAALNRAGVKTPAWLAAWVEQATKAPPRQIPLPALPVVLERAFRLAGLKPPERLQRWARQASLQPFDRAYQEINFALIRLGQPPELNATPFERAASLIGIIPAAADPATALVTQYQLENFSQQPADLNAARSAGAQVRGLSYRAALEDVFQRLQQPFRRHVHPNVEPLDE